MNVKCRAFEGSYQPIVAYVLLFDGWNAHHTYIFQISCERKAKVNGLLWAFSFCDLSDLIPIQSPLQ